MMIDPKDTQTENLPEFPEAQAVLSRVKTAEQAERDEREAFLRDSHALVRVKTPVFVEDPKLARELRAKSLAAARSAEYRDKKKTESGLVLSMTPLGVVAQVKELGGWDKWTDAQKDAANSQLEHEKSLVKAHESALESAKKLASEAQVLNEKLLADAANSQLEHEKSLVEAHESALESAKKLAFEAQVLNEKFLADAAMKLKQADAQKDSANSQLEHEKSLVKAHESALESAKKLASETQVLNDKLLADAAMKLKQANEKNAELRNRLSASQLSKQQKEALKAGEKVLNLTGFKRFLVQKIVGF